VIKILSEILTKTYYGNSVQGWLIALLIVAGAIIIGKILYWFFGNILKKLVSKTKTRIDDILIDMIEEPIVFAIAIFGIWFGFNTLNLTDGMSNFLSNSIQFLIVIDVTWMISRLFEAFYEEYMVPYANKSENDLDDQLFPVIKKVLKFVIWSLGIIVAINNAGYDVGAILAGLGIGGLAVAMASKDTVANIFGGFTIYSDKLFKLKDIITVSGITGKVEEIGLRSTRIRKFDGRVVTIPNADFASTPVENVTSEPTRKISFTIGLTYDNNEKDIQEAMKLLKQIYEKNDNVKDYKISFDSFGDFSLNINTAFYIKKSADILQTKTDVNLEILKVFNKNKLEMAFPTQTLYNIKG
jgi:MscS family membrane protein